jgi:hypothetical protein
LYYPELHSHKNLCEIIKLLQIAALLKLPATKAKF